MLAGIDSSLGIYTGMISGHPTKIKYLHSDLLKEFSKYGIKELHWRKIERPIKDKLRKFVIDSINNSDVVIHIFCHKHIQYLPTKNIIYELLPQHIAFRLSPWLREIEGDFHIDVDDDYKVGAMKTDAFIKNLVETISFQCTGQKINAQTKIKRNGLFVALSTIRTKKGILKIHGHKANSKFSRAIQIIDLVLGYYLENNQGFNRRKVSFWNIFKN